MRIAVFLTDAFVGNDQGIVAAIRANAGTTRVFSFGIGNSVNRWLIEQMAVAGRGASEIVLLADDADKAVARLSKRLETPVLADIRVATEGLELRDMVSGATDLAKGGLVPDVFDAQPLVIHAR
jgi:Ca-activated chloride channel family protein